MESSQHVINR